MIRDRASPILRKRDPHLRPFAAAFASLALTLVAGPAGATPQANAGLTVGGALTDMRTAAGPRAAFHLGARGDVLFLRRRDRDMGIGPYVEFATEAFDTLELGAGASWLVPGWTFPFVFSAGAFERQARGQGWEPGVASSIFVGPRSYNFHSSYDLAGGLFVQARYGLGDARQADIVLGAQIDLTLLAYPLIFAYAAVRR